MSGHSAQTRDQVLVAHAANQIARTSLSQDDFAQALSRELYLVCPEKAVAKEVPDFDQTKAKFINALMNSQAAENTILTLVHRPLKKAVSGAHVCISKASGE